MVVFEFVIGVVFIVIIVAIILYIMALFNGLITLKNNIKKSWANVDVILKQRSDELPNLVSVVKGYMKYESKLLKELTDARTKFLNAKTMQAKADADGIISNALKSVFAVAENYPKLSASENFIQLQNRVTGLENVLADRREFYNDSVNQYNIRIQMIPDMFVARMMGWNEPEVLFKATDEERKYVRVKI